MSKVGFTVWIEFEDKVVDDNEIQEVANNIAIALKEQANHQGLAPEESETFAKLIEVAKDGVIIASADI